MDSFAEALPNAPADQLRKAQATEAAVRAPAPAHRWLHFATLGLFAPEGLRLALSGSPPHRFVREELPHTGRRAFPALRPGRGHRLNASLSRSPSLHGLRRRRTGLVRPFRRYYLVR